MNNFTAKNPPDSPWLNWPLGQRVVVRRKLPVSSSHPYTDVKGTVVKTDDNGVILQTMTGQVIIPSAEIALGKMIPPRPPRRNPRSPRSHS